MAVLGIEVSDAGTGAWYVIVTIDDDGVDKAKAAFLEEDTQVLHFRSHRPRPH